MGCLHRRGAAPGQPVLRSEAACRLPLRADSNALLPSSLCFPARRAVRIPKCARPRLCPLFPSQAEFISKCIPDPLEHGVIDAMRKMLGPLVRASSGSM